MVLAGPPFTGMFCTHLVAVMHYVHTLYLVSYSDHPSTLQEECLGIYDTNALMNRPASYVVMHTCTQLSCTRKLGLEGVCVGGEGGEFIYSEIEWSVRPVYKVSSSCLC